MKRKITNKQAFSLYSIFSAINIWCYIGQFFKKNQIGGDEYLEKRKET